RGESGASPLARQAETLANGFIDPLEEIVACPDRPAAIDEGANNVGLAHLAAPGPSRQPGGPRLVELHRDRRHGNTTILPRPAMVTPAGRDAGYNRVARA